MIATERLYPIRRPLAAACAGAAIAVLGGLIGLGGAEFRLPLLIGIFALFPHRAVRTNLLISLATLAVAAAARLSFVQATNVADFQIEITGMLLGGVAAAWLGAGYMRSIPKSRMMSVIAFLLLATAGLLAAETQMHGAAWSALTHGSAWTLPVAVVAGLLVGAISSLLGVAGVHHSYFDFRLWRGHSHGWHSQRADQLAHRDCGRGPPLVDRSLPLAISARLSGATHGHRLGDRRYGRRLSRCVGADRHLAPDPCRDPGRLRDQALVEIRRSEFKLTHYLSARQLNF
jgi:hypothetical protein